MISFVVFVFLSVPYCWISAFRLYLLYLKLCKLYESSAERCPYDSFSILSRDVAFRRRVFFKDNDSRELLKLKECIARRYDKDMRRWLLALILTVVVLIPVEILVVLPRFK